MQRCNFNAYHVFVKLCANCYYQVDQTQDAASICCVVCGGKGENRSIFCHHLHQHHHHKCHLQMLSMQRPTLLQSRMSNPTLAAPQASLQKTVTNWIIHVYFTPHACRLCCLSKILKTNISLQLMGRSEFQVRITSSSSKIKKINNFGFISPTHFYVFPKHLLQLTLT